MILSKPFVFTKFKRVFVDLNKSLEAFLMSISGVLIIYSHTESRQNLDQFK